MQKKVPLRKCVITQEMKTKKELIRVVRTPDSEVVIDLNGKMNGRGAYLTKDVTVIEKAKKKRTLDHHLKVKTTDELYDQLLAIAGGKYE